MPPWCREGIPMKKTGKHDRMVMKGAEQLRKKGYDVDVFYEYHVGDYTGEMDIRARKGRLYEYHEYKCSLTPKTEKKAMEQFERVRNAYPNMRWKFFLHTPMCVKSFR